MTEESINAVYEDALVNGSDSWFEKDPSDCFRPVSVARSAAATEFAKETDVLDVWFDSGSSCRAVVENRLGTYPADVYCEGSDQHRGWFNKSLVIGTATKGESPFRQLVSHGFMLDSEGKAMSKSIGNVVAPQQIIKNVGADVLRLFMSQLGLFRGRAHRRRDPDARNRRLPANAEHFQVHSRQYRRLRPRKGRCRLRRNGRDRPLCPASPCRNLWNRLTGPMIPMSSTRSIMPTHNYCAVDLSSLYLDILKDRLYASAQDSRERRSAQTALYEILSALVRMLAPIIAHTAEEAWQQMPGEEKPVSVFLAPFPEARSEWVDSELAQKWTKILEVRDSVMLALEEARQSGAIRKPLESRVKLSVPGELYRFLSPYSKVLPSVFIVSQVELATSDDDDLHVEIEQPLGDKCDRCWLVLESVGSHPRTPDSVRPLLPGGRLAYRCRSAIRRR